MNTRSPIYVAINATLPYFCSSFLYILQGIPIGLIAAVPMLLQNRGASYKQQAELSFASSWLVPVQYPLGGFMLLLLSEHVDRWLSGDGMEPNVPLLTQLFFVLNFLAATQDIAVDGWALTMLKRCNDGYASTCNSVGQTAGYFLGYVVFIALESKDICNSYLRDVPSDEGMRVTLPRFLYFWVITFIVAITLVATTLVTTTLVATTLVATTIVGHLQEGERR